MNQLINQLALYAAANQRPASSFQCRLTLLRYQQHNVWLLLLSPARHTAETRPPCQAINNPAQTAASC